MANVEHVALLLSSDWNSWRVRNSNVTPDLTSADLSGKDLTDKDLKLNDLKAGDEVCVIFQKQANKLIAEEVCGVKK